MLGGISMCLGGISRCWDGYLGAERDIYVLGRISRC